MKFLTFPIALLISSMSWAQESTTTGILPTAEQPTTLYSSRGFRVGLIRQNLNYEIRQYKTTLSYTNQWNSTETINLGSATNATNIDDNAGFILGYVRYPIKRLGWDILYSYSRPTSLDSDIRPLTYKLSSNAAYSFSKNVYLKAGLNYTDIDFDNKDNFSSPTMKSDLGMQLALGFQFSSQFGIEIGYTEMNASGSEIQSITTEFDDVFTGSREFDVSLKGVEAALTGTF